MILSGHPGRFQCVGIRCRRTVSTLNVSDTADTVRLRARRSLGILENPTCGRIYVMTLERTTAGINKGRTPAGRTGKSSPPRRCGGSSRRPWPGFLAFRGWIRQETLCDRSSVTFDLRQCTQMRELDLVQTISRNAIFAVLPSRKGYHGPA